MMEFFDLIKEMFPSISPYTAERARESIKELIKKGQKLEFCTPFPFSYLAQGDIIEDIPFVYLDDENQDRELECKGLMLSNTCDAENDDYILFAPILPLEHFISEGFDANNIRSNLYNSLFYLNTSVLGAELVVDFSIINPLPTKLINQLLENGHLKKKATLNLLGYYYFLSKLTMHFMRPEDIDVNQKRYEGVAI